ncbi:MAG TPA: rhodanese-like domain-containing protein [Pyrinomonadaceae bacterium]|nr:rhodanese-like domain-containing protein [Pyrinomonadaceae bacterium]
MRKILLSVLVANGAALALLVAACKAPDGAETARGGANAAASPASTGQAQNLPVANVPVQAPANVVRRLTVAETKEMVDRGEAVIVDVRTKEQYDGGHIKGSISLPRGEVATRGRELPKDKLLVFYCA